MAYENVDVTKLRNSINELYNAINYSYTEDVIQSISNDNIWNTKTKNALKKRLNILINEFAKIEQLLSKSYSLDYAKYRFSLILDQAKDMMLLDDFNSNVKVDLNSDPLLNVDFQLFSLAIKNLIDNALKYSDDKKVIIKCDDTAIYIRNHGKPLDRSIEHYKQAFIRDNSAKASGMGLGLYIIEHICSMHKFSLDYNYIDGYHEFSIKFRHINSEKS